MAGVPSDSRRAGGRGWVLRKEGGVVCFLVEGITNQGDMNAVAGQIAQQMHAISNRDGALIIALPPQLGIRVVTGQEIELRKEVDGRLKFEFRSKPSGGSSILWTPGGNGNFREMP